MPLIKKQTKTETQTKKKNQTKKKQKKVKMVQGYVNDGFN